MINVIGKLQNVYQEIQPRGQGPEGLRRQVTLEQLLNGEWR